MFFHPPSIYLNSCIISLNQYSITWGKYKYFFGAGVVCDEPYNIESLRGKSAGGFGIFYDWFISFILFMIFISSCGSTSTKGRLTLLVLYRPISRRAVLHAL